MKDLGKTSGGKTGPKRKCLNGMISAERSDAQSEEGSAQGRSPAHRSARREVNRYLTCPQFPVPSPMLLLQDSEQWGSGFRHTCLAKNVLQFSQIQVELCTRRASVADLA